jgi:hypothetical protein
MDRPIGQVSVGIRPFQIGLQLDRLGGRHGARREQHDEFQSGEADAGDCAVHDSVLPLVRGRMK